MQSLLRGVGMGRRLPVAQVCRRLLLARSTSTTAIVHGHIVPKTVVQVPKNDLVGVSEGTTDMLDCPRLGDAPAEMIEKKVRIFQPSRKVMQSSSKPGQWRLEFPREKRYQNPLMGWTGTDDTMYMTAEHCKFPTSADAIAYVEKMGYEYEVEEPHEVRSFLGKKSYAANYEWKGPPK